MKLKWLEEIYTLVEKGILSREQCPEPSYRHWDVLTVRFLNDYQEWDEVRCYFNEDEKGL